MVVPVDAQRELDSLRASMERLGTQRNEKCSDREQWSVYPSWYELTKPFDGIHITARAIAATQCVALVGTGGVVAPPYWDVEPTFWLRRAFSTHSKQEAEFDDSGISGFVLASRAHHRRMPWRQSVSGMVCGCGRNRPQPRLRRRTDAALLLRLTVVAQLAGSTCCPSAWHSQTSASPRRSSNDATCHCCAASDTSRRLPRQLDRHLLDARRRRTVPARRRTVPANSSLARARIGLGPTC
jgi:hypothetical protein